MSVTVELEDEETEILILALLELISMCLKSRHPLSPAQMESTYNLRSAVEKIGAEIGFDREGLIELYNRERPQPVPVPDSFTNFMRSERP